jgi:hypothetical protein
MQHVNNNNIAVNSTFFEQLREQSRNEIKSYDPLFEDHIELILLEYFRINPYHMPLRSRFLKWFKQYEKTSPRCSEDLIYAPIYFFPTSKNHDKLFFNYVLTVTLTDIDDLSQANKTFMTDFAINCLRTLSPDPGLPISILELIKAMIGFLAGVDDYVKERYLLIIVNFFKGCQNDHLIDWQPLSYDQYMENRRSVILMRLYSYGMWIVEDKFTIKEFEMLSDVFRDMDEWGVLMNDHLSVWKEIEDEDSGNWIIIKCWQTGDAFSNVYADHFKQTLDNTYTLINKLKTFDLIHHTNIGKNLLHYTSGMYIWNRYSKRYQVKA